MARNLAWLLAGLLSSRISKRTITLIGMGLSVLAYVMAYFSIHESLLVMTLTFGITVGMSAGILSGVCLQYAVDLADGKSGLYTAIARGAMCFGAVPVNQFITLYANPNNEAPDLLIGGSRYFSQTDILDTVPKIYMIMGCIFVGMQVVGFLMMQEKKIVQTDEAPSVNPMEPITHKGGEASYHSTATGPGDQETRNQRHSPSDGPDQSLLTDNMQPTKDLATRDMVRTKDFYILMVSMILGFYSYLVNVRYFKVYGQLYIDDDLALTTMANIVAVAVVFIGLLYGVAMDRYGSKVCLIGYHGCVSVLIWMFYFSPMVHPWAYYVTAFVMSSITSPFVTIYSGVVANLFGREHYTMNLGLLLCLSSLVSLASTPIVGAVLDCGWFYLYAACATMSLMSLLGVLNLHR